MNRIFRLCSAVITVLCLGQIKARNLLDEGSECPPPNFDALADFNITAYISAPWYVQMQMPLIYQPEEDLFCVRATYVPLNADNIFEGLRVNNYANEGQVNGEVQGTSGFSFFPLIATVPDPNVPSKLEVGPDVGFIPGNQQIGKGDYWIVAAGKSNSTGVGTNSTSEYDWAIISGGAPGRETDGGCATGSSIELFRHFQINNIGLWLFSRTPFDPEGTEQMLDVAENLGLDTSVLVKVQQEGCLYLEDDDE